MDQVKKTETTVEETAKSGIDETITEDHTVTKTDRLNQPAEVKSETTITRTVD
jgi:hypothetical protein